MDSKEVKAPARPCSDCPWRLDAELGQFPPERFVALAPTAYDMSNQFFGCHKHDPEARTACAGFLARGAQHNLSVRIAYSTQALELVEREGDTPLYENYREMAIANGVDPEDPALKPCR